MSKNILNFTGERYLPSVGGSIEMEHMHRYLFAKKYVAGKHVLDIASGEGYGSKCLATSAAYVIGVDIDEAVIKYANSKYNLDNLEYLHGSIEAIPLGDDAVDVVVSFETIEHHDKHDEMMAEIKRVLKPDGLLIISSPDKLEYTDLTGYNNPYHVKELYRNEFEQLLYKHFTHTVIQGQRVIYGSLLQSQDDNVGLTSYYDDDQDGVLQQNGIRKAIYMVALASDMPLDSLNTSVYEKPVYMSEIVQELRSEVGALKAQIEQFGTTYSELEQLKLELEVKVDKLEEEKKWFVADRQLILNSLSWKLTAWLRFIMKFLSGSQ